jgi:hypothetical protein
MEPQQPLTPLDYARPAERGPYRLRDFVLGLFLAVPISAICGVCVLFLAWLVHTIFGN